MPLQRLNVDFLERDRRLRVPYLVEEFLEVTMQNTTLGGVL